MDSWSNPLLLVGNDTPALLAACVILVIAYGIFSLMGFGTALLASAPLAWVMPVAQVIPLLAVLDGVGAIQRGYRARQLVDRASLWLLLPGMLLGQVLGVGLLACLPLKVMALLLGFFVMAYGAWGMRTTAAASRAVSRRDVSISPERAHSPIRHSVETEIITAWVARKALRSASRARRQAA